jgi:hypothetical protein
LRIYRLSRIPSNHLTRPISSFEVMNNVWVEKAKARAGAGAKAKAKTRAEAEAKAKARARARAEAVLVWNSNGEPEELRIQLEKYERLINGKV